MSMEHLVMSGSKEVFWGNKRKTQWWGYIRGHKSQFKEHLIAKAGTMWKTRKIDIGL